MGISPELDHHNSHDEGFHDPFNDQVRKSNIVLAWEKQVVVPPKYLIERLLIDGGIQILAGPTSVGKTKLAELFAFAVGTGYVFHSACPINRVGWVVWFAAEGELQAVPYLRCIEQAIGGYRRNELETELATPIAVVPSGELPKLSDPRAVQTMRAIMERAGRAIAKRFQLAPALIVVDTYSRMAGPVDPDKSHLAELIYDKLITIGREFNSTVLVLDHTGKDPEKGVRGSTAKPAATEITMMIKAETGQTSGLLLEIEKNRLGPIPEPLIFNLCTHRYIGDDGVEASDVVPTFHSNVVGNAVRSARNQRWQPARKAFWQCIEDGKWKTVRSAKSDWAEVKAISWNDWKEQYKRDVPLDKKERSIDRSFERAVEDLLGIVVAKNQPKRRDRSRQMVEFDEIAGEKRFWWVATDGDGSGQQDEVSQGG
ncbi:AAA family ATPase [Bradyrhizobium japonicum]|uniref:AAA family ATPase n=1 Tax=Bradyrhizobium japonicum TaxID=375 RepID=UPI0027155138|nr:AAA family ATPase [Bradyrhizobium japonicum]WLB26921.1 AAA family ATPase [Bradyrhizobium japonicum]